MILALLIVGIVPSVATKDSPVFIPADSPHLQYTGRVAKNGSKVLWDWSGVKAAVNLKCDLNVVVDVKFHIDVPVLQTINPLYKDKDCSKYSVLVNGVTDHTFQTIAPVFGKTLSDYSVLLPPSANGVLTLELVKNTEEFDIPVWASWSEGGQPTIFHGITIPASCAVLAPPKRSQRRLEFIGDSITCGFGNLAKGVVDHVTCTIPPVGGLHGWLDFEDFGRAFPTVASQGFSAELHTQCISQIGITRNGATMRKTTPFNMSHYLHRTLPTLPALWDYSSWTPDVAVVNLGTNDYDIAQMVHAQPSLAHFEGNYTNFLTDYIEHYDGRLSHLIVACGPMTKVQCPTVEKVTTTLKASFPKLDVRYVKLTLPKLTGCVFHPGIDGHRQIYEQLVPVISDMTGWIAPRTETALLV